MELRLLYLYKWCTFGGVERVLINRALAFKKFKINVKMDVFFYYGGVINEFKAFIKKSELSDYLNVVSEIKPEKYDRVVSIDTEEAFENLKIDRLILEYHTQYEDHGRYIYKVPEKRIEAVIVPSEYFRESLIKKREDLSEKIYILRNFVIDNSFEEREFRMPDWNLFPVVWIGRTDNLKNPHFLVKALKKFRIRYGDRVFLCVVGSSNQEKGFLNTISDEEMSDRVIYYPNIRFERIKAFLKGMLNRKAIFASASKGESFGMAVAEAIYFGLPVLVSHIKPHAELVEGNEKFLFKLDDKDEFAEKLNYLIENYDLVKKEIDALKIKLEPDSFIKDWQALTRKVFL